MIKKALLLFLKIYQKFFTLIGYGSCRFYPTCSEYAKWQIENNNIFKAIFHTILRILRCNQLFVGGIDYPVIKKNLILTKKKIIVKYWYVPKEKNKYYVIKRFKDNM